MTTREVPGPIAASAKGPQANRYATGKGVTLVVADEGVAEEHQEFAGRFDAAHSGTCVGGGRFDQSPGSWRPGRVEDMHGNKAASSAAAAADGTGIRGLAPEARLAAIRVVDDEGNIYAEASICAAMAAARAHLPIVNHSYGIDGIGLKHAFFDPAVPDHAAVITAVKKAYAWSRAHGTLNVAALGNAGEDLAEKPTIDLPHSESGLVLTRSMQMLLAEVPGVVGVSEADTDGTVVFLSSVGLGLTDLSAVGAGTLATAPGKYDLGAGTSFAAPAVAGTAALVKQLWPAATPAQVEAVLEDSARPASCANAGELSSGQPCRASGRRTSFFGHGHLDALAAVRLAIQRRPVAQG